MYFCRSSLSKVLKNNLKTLNYLETRLIVPFVSKYLLIFELVNLIYNERKKNKLKKTGNALLPHFNDFHTSTRQQTTKPNESEEIDNSIEDKVVTINQAELTTALTDY